MRLSRIDMIGSNGNDGLHYDEVDVLTRLSLYSSLDEPLRTDIADAIDEIRRLRQHVQAYKTIVDMEHKDA